MSFKSRSALHRIFSNTGLLVSSRIVNALCSFAYVAWAAHTLGLRVFGVMLLVTTFANLVSDITHLQSWQTLLHYGTNSFEKKEAKRFFPVLVFCVRSDMISGFVGLLGGIGMVMLLGQGMLGWSHDAQRDGMWLMITVLFMNTGWSTGVIRLCDRFELAALFDFMATCVRTSGFFVGYLYHFGLGYFLFVWFLHQVTLFILTSLCGIWLINRHFGTVSAFIPAFFSPAGPHGWWGFTLRVSANQVLDAVFKQGGTLVVGAILGMRDVAIYRVTRQICEGLAKPAQMMIPSLYPEFVRFRDREDWAGLQHVVLRLGLVVAGFSVAVVLVTVFAGRGIVNMMLHAHFANERVIMLIMVASALLDVCIIPLEALLTVMGQLAVILRGRTGLMIVYFPVLAVLLWFFGVMGAALASLVCSVLMLAICILPTLGWRKRHETKGTTS